MKKSEIEKEYQRILKTCNALKLNDGYYAIHSPFGLLKFRMDNFHRQKSYAIFMRFENDFNIEMFYRYFSKNENINRFSKKWNLHSSNPEWILNELDERLNNMQYILKRDGTVKNQYFKPFLLEIEELNK